MQPALFEPTVASARTIFARVFVPIDFSIASHLALGIALELARTHGSQVCVFHAAESSASDDWLGGIGSPAVHGNWVEDATGELGRFLDNVAPGASARVELRARVGLPAIRVVEEAHAWNATLVVLSAHLHKGMFRTSRALAMMKALDVPTLIVPVTRTH